MPKRKSKKNRRANSRPDASSDFGDQHKGHSDAQAIERRDSSDVQAENVANDLKTQVEPRPAAWMLWAFRLSAVAMVGWMAFLVYLAYQVANA